MSHLLTGKLRYAGIHRGKNSWVFVDGEGTEYMVDVDKSIFLSVRYHDGKEVNAKRFVSDTEHDGYEVSVHSFVKK